MPPRPAARKPAIFRQICELIPAHMVPKLARKHGIRSRGISPWSHVVAGLYAQFTHALGLNDVCDALSANRSLLASIRGAQPPSRNGLSHANRTRPAQMVQDLFWSVLDFLDRQSHGWGGGSFHRLPRRFRRAIHAIDSTTLALFAHCMDWARHRRRKAAAKLHLRLNLETFLPAMAVVDSARGHDSIHATRLCAGLKAGEIAVFDMAYMDYKLLNDLDERGIFWVGRARENIRLQLVKRRLQQPQGNILQDDEVRVELPRSRARYPRRLRQVTAIVELDGQPVEMAFLTNHLEWAASSICDLYRSRWNIETFFRQIKQTLHLGDFLGHNRMAIEWQIWTALLMYVLLRHLHRAVDWAHSFTRLFTCLRAVIWQRRWLLDYLTLYGTAGGSFRLQWAPHQAYLPGLEP